MATARKAVEAEGHGRRGATGRWCIRGRSQDRAGDGEAGGWPVRDPRIVFLDEAANWLDRRSQAALMGDAPAFRFRLEPSDALAELIDSFFGARARQSLSPRRVLRIVNPHEKATRVEILGIEVTGNVAGTHRVTIEPRRAVMLDAATLEEESFGVGVGKWRLEVYAEREVWVMSLLRTRSGHVSNLSTLPPRLAVPAAPEPESDPE